MYSFVDTNTGSEGAFRASEACSINGVYLEDAVPGYRTLSVSGRDSVSATPRGSGVIPGRDGELLYETNIAARTIRIRYYFRAESPALFSAAADKLKCVLFSNRKKRVIRFDDEPGVTYEGAVVSISNANEGALSATGEIEILCPSVYKFSEERTLAIENGAATLPGEGAWGFPVALQKITLAIGGTAQKIRISNPRTAQSIVVNGDFSAGQTIVFDFDKVLITKNDVSITPQLDFAASDFPDFELRPADQLLIEPQTDGQLTYRETFL